MTLVSKLNRLEIEIKVILLCKNVRELIWTELSYPND